MGNDKKDISQLQKEVSKLQKRNKKLTIQLMRQSAQLSEAEEKLKHWKTELEIVAEQRGHNLCWIWIPKLLKNTLGHIGGFPDPEGVTREEFALGCESYQEDIFGPKKGRRGRVGGINEY